MKKLTEERCERWETFKEWANAEVKAGRLELWLANVAPGKSSIFSGLPRGFADSEPLKIGRQIRPSGRCCRPLYLVECESCGEPIVRSYDHVSAQARYGVGSLCRATDGIKRPCGPPPRKARAVEVEPKVKRLIDRVAERSRDRVALSVLLSKVKRRESYPLDWQDDCFWRELAKRVIQDPDLGYDAATVEHMVSHARAALSVHQNRTNHATESI